MTKKPNEKRLFTTEIIIPDCPTDDLEGVINYLSKQSLLFSTEIKHIESGPVNQVAKGEFYWMYGITPNDKVPTAIQDYSITSLLDEAKNEFPKKERCSKTYGTPESYDDYNIFDYKHYNTEDLESCQELIEAFEEWFKKWFGEDKNDQ